MAPQPPQDYLPFFDSFNGGKKQNYPCFALVERRGHGAIDDVLQQVFAGSTCKNDASGEKRIDPEARRRCNLAVAAAHELGDKPAVKQAILQLMELTACGRHKLCLSQLLAGHDLPTSSIGSTKCEDYDHRSIPERRQQQWAADLATMVLTKKDWSNVPQFDSSAFKDRKGSCAKRKFSGEGEEDWSGGRPEHVAKRENSKVGSSNDGSSHSSTMPAVVVGRSEKASSSSSQPSTITRDNDHAIVHTPSVAQIPADAQPPTAAVHHVDFHDAVEVCKNCYRQEGWYPHKTWCMAECRARLTLTELCTLNLCHPHSEAHASWCEWWC